MWTTGLVFRHSRKGQSLSSLLRCGSGISVVSEADESDAQSTTGNTQKASCDWHASAERSQHSSKQHGSHVKCGSLLLGLSSEEVEAWQAFPYLHSGYRKGGSYVECLKSLFLPHNELVNAWTMILSCILNTYLCLKALAVVQPRGWDVAPFVMAWFGQAIHAPFSAGYHTFMCICPTTANAWRRADLSMIFIMSACGTFALSYFTLGLRGALLWSLLDACIGVAGIRNVLKLQPKQKLSRQGILGMITLANLGYYIPMATRAVMTLHAPSLYAAVNMSAVAAAQSEFGPQPTGQSHQSALTSRAYSSNSSALSYSTVNAWMLPEVYVTVLLFVCHVAGATAYALHWPQRQFPRIFDMIGFSHNVMHVLICVAYNFIYAYLIGTMAARDGGKWIPLWQ